MMLMMLRMLIKESENERRGGCQPDILCQMQQDLIL
jgi:hypothetical protein